MEIQKSSAPLAIPSAPNALHRMLSRLQPGQSLDAVVTSKLAENSFVLKLADGMLLNAQTPGVLELGQMLKLEVIKAGTVPELKIIFQEHTAPAEQSAVANALRQWLPKQQNLADAISALQQLAAQAGKTDGLAAVLKDALAALPAKTDLMTAEGLKRGVDNAGVFLEAKLAEALTAQPDDLKAHLLKLASLLQQKISGERENPPALDLIRAATAQAADAATPDRTLLAKIEGALARIIVDQLASAPQQDGQQQVWRLEIPFTDGRHADSVKLAVSRDGKGSQPNTPAANWTVALELNPPGLGTLYARINFADAVVNTYFWSDSDETAAWVRDHLDVLSARYAAVGLTPGQLNALTGRPTDAKSADSPSPAQLLDERA